MLFSKVLEMWWIGKKLSLREISIHRLRMIINTHILPFFGDLEIVNVDDIVIINFINVELSTGNHNTGKGLCKNSVIKEVDIVKEVLKYAFNKGIIERDVTVLIKRMKKEPVKEYEIFTADEVDRLIKVARPKWLGDMILLAYNTGLRKCECFGLQWENIDFKNKRLVVVRSVTAAKPGDRFISMPKTKSSNRVVLLDDETLFMLKKRYDNRMSDIWVFANKNGELLSPWYHVKYFRTACKLANVSGKRFYDLRHTHITEMIEMGAPIPVIQQRVGHSNINMTMHYTHIKTASQISIVNIINKKGG